MDWAKNLLVRVPAEIFSFRPNRFVIFDFFLHFTCSISSILQTSPGYQSFLYQCKAMFSIWYHFFIYCVSLYEFVYPLTIVEALILYQKISKDFYTKNIGILPVTLPKLSQCHGFNENPLISLEFLLNYEWGLIYKKTYLFGQLSIYRPCIN